MKHKIGEKTSSSLLPRTHGPRRDYSRSISKASMVMEGPPEINPSSVRVPGQELLQIPISGSWRRRNNGVDGKKESSSRVFGTKGKYRRLEGHQGVAHLAKRPGGAAKPWPSRVAAWLGDGPPLAQLRASGGFRQIRISGIFWDFSGNIDFSPFFLRCTDKNRQKLALGTRLIG